MARRSLAVKLRGMECRCLARRNMTNDPLILTWLNLMKNSKILIRDFLLSNTIN